MKVTITLGEKAMEYVTGIPEEELPEILSDVLERSLAQQVKPIQQEPEKAPNADEELLSKIMELLRSVEKPKHGEGQKRDESTFSNKRNIVVETVAPSALSGLDGDDLDLMDLLK